MHPLLIALIIALAVVIAAILAITVYTYFRVFYNKKRPHVEGGEVYIPRTSIYEPYRERILEWVRMTREMGGEVIKIKSDDGLDLYGYYYEYAPGALTEILFHGYHGNAERDLSGGVDRCHRLGRNALIVDQRAGGRSGGVTTTFGIKESRDCLRWVDYAIGRFGKDVKLILTGVSMGAATVMIAAGDENLPKNVVSVLADCGYTSAKEIISKFISEMHLPPKLIYPFVRLGGMIFGRFDADKYSPIEAMKRTRVPIIFIHGDADDFVPTYMSQVLYEACASEKKKFVKIEGAGHGIAFPANEEAYIKALADFEAECDGFPITD